MYIKAKKQNEQIGIFMKEFVAHTVDFYNHLASQPVSRPVKKNVFEYLKELDIPTFGRPVQEVYTEMLRDVYPNTSLAQHPRNFSCIPSTASLLSWMGDVMTNAYNPHASCQINAPAANLIEEKMIRWMCDMAGFPKESGGAVRLRRLNCKSDRSDGGSRCKTDI